MDNIVDMKRRLNVRRTRIRIAVILVVVIVVCVAAATAMYYGFMAKSITYEGSSHYSDEELDSYIFDGKNTNILLYKLFGDKDRSIPFIQRYDVDITWPDKMTVTVYEKPVVGYVTYMGSNMYFDKDGTVVESTDDYMENVPEVVGIEFTSIVLNQKLVVDDDTIFTRILDLTQSFEKYQLDVSKIYFDNDSNVILYIGNVKISLGNDADYTDKLFELKQLSSSFGNLKGTLYMDDYNGTDESLIFKKE